MSESEQAQAIKNTRELLQIARYNSIEAVAVSVEDELLEIVDSQAQKIEHQKAEISVTKTMLNDMNELVAKQAKEIESLKTQCEAYKRQNNPHSIYKV